MNAYAVELEGIVNRFGKHVVHDGVELKVHKGEVLGLIGGSGSGKSVMLRTMTGLRRPQAGKVKLFGDSLSDAKARELTNMRSRFGLLFQSGALFGSLTVAENIEMPLRERFGLSGRLASEISGLKLALVGLPQNAASKYPSELSGGMKKRAGLARALALDPELLFLDEPTAGLDPIGAHDFDMLIRDLQQSLGLTVVMITHDLDSLHRICDRIAVLLNKKVMTGTIPELSVHEDRWLQEYFNGPRGRSASEAILRDSGRDV